MRRVVFITLFALLPTSTLRADDEWLGQWVFPRSKDTPLVDRDDKVLMKWSSTAGKVTWVGKEWITIRHGQYPGPYEGYVKKSEVVKLIDALPHFTDRINASKKDAWAFSRRAEAWTIKDIRGFAIKDLNEAIRLDPSPTNYIQRGTACYLWAEYDKAIKDYDEVIRLDPKDARAFNGRGNAWYELEEYDKAIKDLTEALRIDPKYAQAFYNRNKVWIAKRDFDKAIEDVNENIRLDPTDPEAFIFRGNLRYACWEYGKANDDYTEAIRLNPKHSVAFFNRGITKLRQRLDRRALDDFNEAIRVDSKFVDPLLRRSSIWMSRKDFDKAIEDCTAAIKIDSRSALAYYIRGHALYSRKEYEKSITDLSEAIELEPMNVKAYCNRGLSRNARKDYDKAIEDFSAAISLLELKQQASKINRGLPWSSRNEYALAITDFDENDRPIDTYPDPLTGRAIAWQNKGKYDKASNDFSRTVDLKSGLGTPYSCGSFAWLLATCPDSKYRDGKWAVQLATLANRMSRGNAADSLDVLAAAYAESGEFEEAINYEKQAIEATDKKDKDNLEQRRARLKLFEQKKPYREPEKKE